MTEMETEAVLPHNGKELRTLNPRDSAAFVMQKSEHVKVCEDGIRSTAKLICEAISSGEFQSDTDFTAHKLHPKAGDAAAVQWIFFMDTINFSFWTEKDSLEKFEVTYQGDTQTGYFAACACANRALEQGIPLTSAKFMANVKETDLKTIFKGDHGSFIPMVSERVQALNEAGLALMEKFGGSFYNCIRQCDNSALKLLQLIVENFPSYRDYADYQGQSISFLKRAQILVADAFWCLKAGNDPLGDWPDFDQLTIFADYRVPQVLAYLGALKYSDSLLEALRQKKLMLNGSQLEVEIRAGSVHACELVTVAVNKLLQQDKSQQKTVTAAEVDNYLWTHRRKVAQIVEQTIPYHRYLIKMFKKFDQAEDITGTQQLKSSVQKGIRIKLLEQFPGMKEHLEEVLPKKETFKQVRCKDHLEMIANDAGTVLFIKHRDLPYMPTLRLLHKYPYMLPHQQVDKGAIKFVLKGSNIMCPGLTSPGAKLTDGVEKDSLVAVMAEGKQHALAIGLMKMSTDEIKSVNKGNGIDNIHFLNDGLWRVGAVL